MTNAESAVTIFRTTGRAMALGIDVRPPRLPRSAAARQAIELEASKDLLVRRAYQAAIVEAEQQRQLEPQTITRFTSGPVRVMGEATPPAPTSRTALATSKPGRVRVQNRPGRGLPPWPT